MKVINNCAPKPVIHTVLVKDFSEGIDKVEVSVWELDDNKPPSGKGELENGTLKLTFYNLKGDGLGLEDRDLLDSLRGKDFEGNVKDVTVDGESVVVDKVATIDTSKYKATTLAGYGITDAKIENNQIILGSDSLTPVLSFKGEFNADECTESGWYDSIVLGCPEGTESDEKYFMYVSSNGGLVCFSKRNSGKVYHRLGIGHPWVAVTHDDYSLEHSSVTGVYNYIKEQTLLPSQWSGNFTGKDDELQLAEVYAGLSSLDVTEIDLYKKVTILPNSIIRVKCFYRTGDGENKLYDSDAYLYLSNKEEADHSINALQSDFIKIKSLGSYGFNPLPNNLTDVHNLTNLPWIYIKTTNILPGEYYLHIHGNFSIIKSWLCLGETLIFTPELSDKIEVIDGDEEFTCDKIEVIEGDEEFTCDKIEVTEGDEGYDVYTKDEVDALLASSGNNYLSVVDGKLCITFNQE